MQLQRLSRLSDIIFAGAMTLMALTFEPLPLKDKTPQEVSVFVQEQLPSFAVYVLTFIGIAFYWISHLQQFQYYKQTDVTHIWLTLLSLLFVVVLPYANDLSTVHDGVFVIQCFYSLSVAGVGIFSTAAWIYATQNRRLVAPELSDITIRRIRQETYAEPIVSLLAIGGALIHPWGWILTFILGFPLIFLIQRLFRIEE
mgnify:FL=1